jgi:hypothetical protein
MRTLVLLLLAALAVGCEDKAAPTKTSLGSVRVPPHAGSALPPPKPPTAASQLVPVRPPVEICRAISVSGVVKRRGDAQPLGKHASLDDAPWLTLERGARVSIMHARTAREVALIGPAVAQPCYRRGEAFLLSRGTLRSTAGAGARPGAEVLVATPHGVVRYANASLDLHVSETTVEITVRSGSATFEAAGNGDPKEVGPEKPFRHEGAPAVVKPLLASCNAASREASGAAEDLGAGDAKGKTLGERAARHFRLRRAARKACGIAAAALGTTDSTDDLAAQWDALDAAERLWRGRKPRQKVVE